MANLIVSFPSPQVQCASNNDVDFDKEHIGVFFYPDTRPKGIENSYYSMAEVESMLELVSKRFQRISSEGMGIISELFFKSSNPLM